MVIIWCTYLNVYILGFFSCEVGSLHLHYCYVRSLISQIFSKGFCCLFTTLSDENVLTFSQTKEWMHISSVRTSFSLLCSFSLENFKLIFALQKKKQNSFFRSKQTALKKKYTSSSSNIYKNSKHASIYTHI